MAEQAERDMTHAQKAPGVETIADEVLRSRIRKIIDEPRRESIVKRLSTNPILNLVLGFVLTGVVGVILTNHYNAKQKELESQLSEAQRDREREKDERQKDLEREKDERRKDLDFQRNQQERQRELEHDDRQKQLEFQRSLYQKELDRVHSFSDELSKSRIQKFGEVWEKAYLYEGSSEQMQAIALDRAWLRAASESSEPWTKFALEHITKLVEARRVVDGRSKDLEDALVRNRFWIDEASYLGIRDYIKATDGYLKLLHDISSITSKKTPPPEEQKKLEELQSKVASMRKEKEIQREHIGSLRKRLLNE